MDTETKRFIDNIFEKAADGKVADRNEIVKMLGIDPESVECEYLGTRARELSGIITKNRANIGTAFGLDYHPCEASCRFCSFGKKWGLMKEEYIMPDETVIELIGEKLKEGYSAFTLRTTEFYSVNDLCALGKKIREHLPEKYRMSVNTGELTAEDANRLYEAGFNSAYHTLHLREGIDTPFPPETRLATMRTIKNSKLKLSCGVDPIGIEHSDEEIADNIVTLREFDPISICSMKRINVKGTPVGNLEEVSDARIAQIAAVIRFASRGGVSAVPPTKKAFEWGANGTSIGTGSNPRDDVHDKNTIGNWRMDHSAVKRMIEESGYELIQP